MKPFKIRASKCGKIMGQRGLGKTGENYLKDWIKEQVYGRQKQVRSKYLQKGKIMEDEAIDFASKWLDLFLVKNERDFEDKHITGTPDIIIKKTIMDIKNSWDFSTFPLLDIDVPNEDYYWQGQCYMALTGAKDFKLIYTLMDTPLHLIRKEAYYYCMDNGFDELDQDIYEEFVDRMTYDDIEDKYRIRIFEFERNDEDIEKIRERVMECRKLQKYLIKSI